MRISNYTIRNFRPEDFNNYVSLTLNCGKREPNGRPLTLQAINQNQNRPNYNPQKDLIIAESGEALIGYIDLTPEQTIGRVILDGLIHPDYCSKELALALLDRAFERARALGITRAHANIFEEDLQARNAVTSLGFTFVRRFKELDVLLNQVSFNERTAVNLRYRHLCRGEENLLALVQNKFFAGTWGYNPNTAEEIACRINMGNSSPEDIILALDGNRVAGYCWTSRFPEEGRGRILMLGVDPGYRGLGVGKSILLQGLSYLLKNGLDTAELTVDFHNRAACALYASVGFKHRTGSLWYERYLK